MKRIINVTLAGVAAAALALSLGASAPAFAQMKEKEKSVTVGGAPMYPSKNIVQNAVNSKDHTTLVAAVKAAGLVDTLQSPGPFTVFAPTNEAFAKLPAGTVDTLLKPENPYERTHLSRCSWSPECQGSDGEDQDRQWQSHAEDRRR
jgi:uncharacterized surface protein with fasciclin (FAS1) repeats